MSASSTLQPDFRDIGRLPLLYPTGHSSTEMRPPSQDAVHLRKVS
jgi:hypothetical protein